MKSSSSIINDKNLCGSSRSGSSNHDHALHRCPLQKCNGSKRGGGYDGSFMAMLCGALGAALVGYGVGYFYRNDSHTLMDTFRRILAKGSTPKFATGPSLVGCTISNLFATQPVHGMHLVCIQHSPTGLFATVFIDGQNGTQTEISAPAYDFQGLRTVLEEELMLAPFGRRDPRGPRGMETPNTQQPWAMFTPQGLPVDSLLDLQEGANDILLYEGGRFIWPGVREGHITRVTQLDGLGSIDMRTLSMSPLVFAVDGFLLAEECQYIRETAQPHMRQSGVKLMDHDKGKAATEWRTSSTHFLPTRRHEGLQRIDRRVAGLTRQPVAFQEDVQVLRYEHTQRYDTHHDYFDRRLYAKDPDTIKLIDGGKRNRMATVLWYLSDVSAGGETIFPLYNSRGEMHEFRNCERMHGALRSPPKEGSVIMFYSLLPNGDLDHRSLHGSCAVKDGVKWAANKWIWNDEISHILGHA